MSIGSLIEQLCVLNIKLFNCCNTKADIAKNPNKYSKAAMAQNAVMDIELCKQRAKIKQAIDCAISTAITEGRVDVIDEVKNYGL